MRIHVLAGVSLLGAVLGGCNTSPYATVPDPVLNAKDAKLIAQMPQTVTEMKNNRYMVDDPTGEAAGTITVDTRENFLYYSLGDKKAVRYAVATGNEAAGWSGTATVQRKAEWPRWMPPKEMIDRWPHLKPTYDAGGLPGGPENPLGARALYLYAGGKDTLYRIHGTNEPEEIGHSVSSGCIRMRDIDVIDLYNRAKLGTKVVVK